MGNNTIKPLPQTSNTLQKLFDCFRENQPAIASDIVGLIEKKVMKFDPNDVFVGTINIHWFDNLLDKLKGINIDIKTYCQNKSDTYINYNIDKTKPYLLAFIFILINNQWHDIFKRLFWISNASVSDRLFGYNFFELFLMGKNMPAYFGHEWHDIEVSRKLLTGVEIGRIKCKIFDDPIWFLIKDNNPEMLKDIFEFAHWKGAMKENYLYKINEMGNRLHFIELLLKYTDLIFEPVHQDYCFMQAIKCRKIDYVYKYLEKGIIEKFMGNCILHYMFDNLFVDAGVVKKVIEIGKGMNLDLVNLHNGDGKTPLWILCEKLTVKNYDGKIYDFTIKLLIENGADIYHNLDGTRLIDIVIEKNMYLMARKMAEWAEEFDKINS
jgi:hypothetical protein